VRTRQWAAAISVSVAALLSGACTGDGPSAHGDETEEQAAFVGVILPEMQSSRWEIADRHFLEEAFEAAGAKYDIQNAHGDRVQFMAIADQMLTSAVDVLVIATLDSDTSKAVVDKARSQGVATIEYDRLTPNGGAQYFVGFDNIAAGELQAHGLVQCLTETGVQKPVVATLHGSPTDNEAKLFAEGYDRVLDEMYAAGTLIKGPDHWVPAGEEQQGGTIFEQMLAAQGGNIHGVLAANDDLSNAAIEVLKRNNLNGLVPVTGQGATLQGLQNILVGDQCMTVYPAVKQQADAAADLAVSVAQGNTELAGSVIDPQSGADIPAVLLAPEPITFANVKALVDEGYVTKEKLCAGAFAGPCGFAGIQ
jgi:D-xylose transport system substrate-binding protein